MGAARAVRPTTRSCLLFCFGSVCLCMCVYCLNLEKKRKSFFGLLLLSVPLPLLSLLLLLLLLFFSLRTSDFSFFLGVNSVGVVPVYVLLFYFSTKFSPSPL